MQQIHRFDSTHALIAATSAAVCTTITTATATIQRVGATIGCMHNRCNRVYHMPCAAQDGEGWDFERADQVSTEKL
jgi:PHD-like zinc-binding domain